MKKYLLAPILACAFAVLPSPLAFAQWDYNQDSSWNMADARRDIRRTRERMRANRKKGRAATRRNARTRKGKASRKRATVRRLSAAPTKPAPAPLPRYGIEISNDSWNEFPRDELMKAKGWENGYKVDFSFTSVTTGKTILTSARCKPSDMDSHIEGIPAGTYTVRAEVPFRGTKYQALIGSQEGSTDDPKGGDFASSFKIVLKPIIDEGGSRVMGISPEKIYIRVLKDTGVKWPKS